LTSSLAVHAGNGQLSVLGETLVSAVHGVTAPIPRFVAFEMGNPVDAISRFGSLAAAWSRTAIAVLRMEAVVDMTAEAFRAMKPRARANEGTTGKPL